MDDSQWLDTQWPEISENPEKWARGVAWALPIEHPGKLFVQLAQRHGQSEAEGEALFDRLFAEWKRVYSGAEEAATVTENSL